MKPRQQDRKDDCLVARWVERALKIVTKFIVCSVFDVINSWGNDGIHATRPLSLRLYIVRTIISYFKLVRK